MRAVNRRVVESFIKSGCFDALDPRRAALFAAIDRGHGSGARSASATASRASRASSGCSGGADDGSRRAGSGSPTRRAWSEGERLAFEKESLGFFITGHPLERYRAELAQWATRHDRAARATMADRREVDGGRDHHRPAPHQDQEGRPHGHLRARGPRGQRRGPGLPRDLQEGGGPPGRRPGRRGQGQGRGPGRRQGAPAGLGRAAPRAGQAGRCPLRDHPRADGRLGPAQGREAPGYTRLASRRLPGHAGARPARRLRGGRGPERLYRVRPDPCSRARSRPSSARVPWSWPGRDGDSWRRPGPRGSRGRHRLRGAAPRAAEADRRARARFPGDPAKEKEAGRLRAELEAKRREVFGKLTPWQKTLVARHPNRPYTLDYVQALFTDWTELHGDRRYGDDPALVCGFALYKDRPVAVVGHQKGRDTKQKIYRNFGMPKPEGYRKALRVMELAAKFAPARSSASWTRRGPTPASTPRSAGRPRPSPSTCARWPACARPIIVTVTGRRGQRRRAGHRGRATASTCSSTPSTR